MREREDVFIRLLLLPRITVGILNGTAGHPVGSFNLGESSMLRWTEKKLCKEPPNTKTNSHKFVDPEEKCEGKI